MEKTADNQNLMFERIYDPTQDYKLSSSVYGAHAKIIGYVGHNKKVLDVGCGSGYLGKILKEHSCSVVGIESDEARVKEAQKFLDKVILGDAETINELPFPLMFFDTIILADVLEHMNRPDIFLSNIRKYLKKEGVIIVSVPNIARIDIRLKLLFGKFTYENGGILDKTHLRFFTWSSINKLLDSCGFTVIAKDYSGIISRIRILRSLFRLLSFQFIIVGKPKEI